MIINTTGPTAAIDTINNAGVVIQLLGSWNGSVVIEGSADQSTGSWLPLPVSVLAGVDRIQITTAGTYIVSLATRYIRINVFALTGSITATIIGRSAIDDSGLDILDLASDLMSGVRLSVSTELKKDTNSALVPSDAPATIYGAGSANNAIMIQALDTTGYQSLAVQLFGTFSATVTFYESNDVGGGWVAVAGWPIGGASAPTSAPTAVGLWSVPAVGRFFRAAITAYTSGTPQISITPRQQPAYHADSVPAPQSVNQAQIAGTNTVTAGVGGLQAVGGNVAAGTTATSNPVPLGAVDASSLTRRVLSDALGRLQVVGQLPVGISPYNLQPLPIVDVTATPDGNQSMPELLLQILTELRVTNTYLCDLPLMLNKAITGASWDEPGALRTDPQMTTT